MEQEYDIYFSHRTNAAFGIVIQFSDTKATSHCRFVRLEGDALFDLSDGEAWAFLTTSRRGVDQWTVEFSTVEPEIAGLCLLSMLKEIEKRLYVWATAIQLRLSLGRSHIQKLSERHSKSSNCA